MRQLTTRQGKIRFSAFVPVSTFGDKYPLDNLIRPYLPRLAPAVMVSLYYARQMTPDLRPSIPLLVDSSGYALLFEGGQAVKSGSLGILEINRQTSPERLHPRNVLDFQERVADVGFTLDFPIPPNTPAKEAERRQELTIANAH